MKTILGLTSALMVFTAPAMAFELSCERDDRPVDGDMVKIHLQVDDATGNADAVIEQESNSRAASHSEKTTLRALNCKVRRAAFKSVDCTGPYTFNVSEMELVAPGGGGFMRRTNVTTTFNNKSYFFGGTSEPSRRPNDCDWKF